MTNSHASPLLSLFLAEFTFGLLYAVLIHWISVNNYLSGSTAWSVVIGDAATLFIQWLFIRDNWDPWVTFWCFACSGFPMVVTYLLRYQVKVEKKKHTRRPWPTFATGVRDEAVMMITDVIGDIEAKANTNEVTAGFLLGVTNTLHSVKTLLKSV
jgi:hypothetical protein